MKIMREYIKQLEEKLKQIDGQGSEEKPEFVKPIKSTTITQENITLEITEN